MNLADTLTRELVWKYHEMNFGETAYKPRFEFSLEKNDPHEFMEAVRGFVEMGGEVSQRQAREILGLTEPEEGEPVLSSQQQQEEMAEPGQEEENPLAALLGGGQPRSEAFKKYTYALKTEMQKEDDYKPTDEMASLAERGLELREEHGRGGTSIGVARARNIKNKDNLSAD
jgi:phage gp29-like protein